MSGGSFNYLCFADTDVLLSGSKQEDLEAMRDSLIEQGFDDAAADTDALLSLLRASRAEVSKHVEPLRGIWKAIEWHQSCDWGPDRVLEAIDKYRATKDRRQ